MAAVLAMSVAGGGQALGATKLKSKSTKKSTAKARAKPAPANAATTAVSAATTATQDRAVFAPCDSGLECADISVPLDPAHSGGNHITLFVSRRPASNPAIRIGTLFVNPGGPGGPAFDLVRSAKNFLTTEVLDRFDVVGVDPRGTDRSAPLDCSFDNLSTRDLVFPADNSQLERSRAVYANLGKACSLSDGKKLAFMDTTTAARDIDAVRVAIGEEKISFLGMSYGTYLGAVYESLYPERTQSIVLDSAIDPSRFGVNQVLDPIAQSEVSLDAFLTACANGALSPCRFSDGTDLRVKFNTVRETFLASRRNRSRAENKFDSTINSLIGYPRNGWPVLGRALQELAEGRQPIFEGTPADNLAASDRERIVPADRFSPTTNTAIICADGILPRDHTGYQTIVDQIPVLAPRFSGLRLSQFVATTCEQWPTATAALTPLRSAPGATLVIGNNYDPTTPIAWSRALAGELGSAFLVRNGGGHVAVDKSACVQEAVARFLIDRVAPAQGTVCSPDIAHPS